MIQKHGRGSHESIDRGPSDPGHAAYEVQGSQAAAEQTALLLHARSWHWGVAALILLLLVPSAVALSGQWQAIVRLHPPAPEPPEEAAPLPALASRPVEILPGLYLLGSDPLVASYVVKTSQGLVLIDTEFDKDAALLKQQLTMLGLDWHRTRAILLTHVHGDHTGGAQVLRAATGAKIYIGAADAAVLRAGEPREAFYSNFPFPDSIKPTPTPADVEVADEQVITIDDVRFRALSTPGHSPGSICYLMELAGQRVLFSGDVIWSLTDRGDAGHYGRPLGSYAAYMSPRYRGDATSYLSTLRRLRAMPAPNLVLPGHPHHDDPPASPQMTPERWAALLDPGISEMSQLVALYHRDGATFLDGSPRQLMTDLYYLGDLGGIAVYGLFSAGKFFVVNAPPGLPMPHDPPGPSTPGTSAAVSLPDFIDQRLHALGLPAAVPTAVLLPSGDAEISGGLPDLIKKHHPVVVASAAAWERLRPLCPAGTQALLSDDLARQGWFPATTLPLDGRGAGPLAYRLTLSGHTILLTGRMPFKHGRDIDDDLRRDFASGQGDPSRYGAALRRLGQWQASPDLWLPAIPVDDQNAHLYGSDWQDMLIENEQVARTPILPRAL